MLIPIIMVFEKFRSKNKKLNIEIQMIKILNQNPTSNMKVK
jgi:hypothetical protein